ncbi:uncharacterized protein LOC132627143 [Lycium barbarum]|uniref:uncharacterized protein LOC132627143 n=1 Tax=Lycium barbarum TaxID=112863 RepID=UPI00293EF209|nr:uncharacterized protein LOC132627143 [Lycium barbarum]
MEDSNVRRLPRPGGLGEGEGKYRQSLLLIEDAGFKIRTLVTYKSSKLLLRCSKVAFFDIKLNCPMGEDQLGQALEGCDVVIIPAGVPQKPGMIRDDLFNINAGIVKSYAQLSQSIALM